MKKLIALISAVAVMGTMSLTSLAAIEATPSDENASLAINADGGYSASYTSDAVNTQTTILAVKGTTIDTNSIMYINQLTQDTETTINFDLKEDVATGETVYVYLGGDAIDKTEVGTITNAADANILWGDVDGSNEVDAIDASWILTKAANSETVLANPDAADVDGSTEIDAIDAAWVLTKAANSETVFPVEE